MDAGGLLVPEAIEPVHWTPPGGRRSSCSKALTIEVADGPHFDFKVGDIVSLRRSVKTTWHLRTPRKEFSVRGPTDRPPRHADQPVAGVTRRRVHQVRTVTLGASFHR